MLGFDMQLSSQEARDLGQFALRLQQYNIDWARLSEAEAKRQMRAIIVREGFANSRAVARIAAAGKSKDWGGALLSVVGDVTKAYFASSS